MKQKNIRLKNNRFTKNFFRQIITCLFFYVFFSLSTYLAAYDKSQLCAVKSGWDPVSDSKKNILIEGFENPSDWQTIIFKNESLKLSKSKGISGNALHIEYDLSKESDDAKWVYFDKPVKGNIDFTKSHTISFWLRAHGRPNELQLQFIDADGSVFIKAYWSGAQTSDWHKKEFHISELAYGWGGKNKTLDPPLKLAFAICMGNNTITGGAGWVELDKLQFNHLNPHLELSMSQVGFNPFYNKSAVVKLVNYDQKINSKLDYKIISLTDGKTKYKGQVKPYKKKMWNAQYWVVSFDNLKTSGKYKLKASLKVKNKVLKIESYPFEIKKDVLIKTLGEPLFYYIKATRYPIKLKHFDPVPGGYIDTEFDIEKWMTTTPTWQWGMSCFYNLLKDKKMFTGYDPLDEIKYATKFGMDMQDKNYGGIYVAVNARGLDGKIWPFDVTIEEDTFERYLNKSINVDTTTAHIIGTVEAAKSVQKKSPNLAKKYIDSAAFSWKYLAKRNLSSAENMGMYIWSNTMLYNFTREKKYLAMAKKYTEKLLPLQFLDYQRNDQKVFGKFFGDSSRKNFDYQYKFVHKMGMFMGLIDLAEVLKRNDPLTQVHLYFQKNAFPGS